MLDPGKRWELGVPHHKASELLMHKIADLDFKHCNDYFCWKYGGDGDNGETLMYLMDMIFEDPFFTAELMPHLSTSIVTRS